jgi:hypothetical protein
MTRDEHLMVIAMEECDEVSQRFSKALRFGMTQVQPGQDETNRERILGEFAHLCAALHMLGLPFVPDQKAFSDKQVKVEAFLHYSRHCGRLHAAGELVDTDTATRGHCGDGGVITTQHGPVCATCYHPIEAKAT